VREGSSRDGGQVDVLVPTRRWHAVLQALLSQEREDRALLRSKVLQLRGAAGGARFDTALADASSAEQAAFADLAAAPAADMRAPAPQVSPGLCISKATAPSHQARADQDVFRR
jgi:hypothetical protein